MKYYEITAIQFDGTKIYGEEFEDKMTHLEYKPTLEEIKSCYGKGLEFIVQFVISEYDEENDDYYNEEIIDFNYEEN